MSSGSRVEASAIAVSWIPREAIDGMPKLPFELGMANYDPPPPERIDDLEVLHASNRFRFVNEVRGWVEVGPEGTIIGQGQSGCGRCGVTSFRLGHKQIAFQAVEFPDIQPEPEVGQHTVRFVQTAGGRTGIPAPRRLGPGAAFRVGAPPAWTTVALTIGVDGTSRAELIGASPFPRHWLYDGEGRLIAKSGLIDFGGWYYRDTGTGTPWGGTDVEPIVMPAESEIERRLSEVVIGSEPKFVKLSKGATLVEQGSPGGEVFLLFDGVLEVERDGEVVAEFGPGAIMGEMALVEGGVRTATLRAVTPCRIASVPGDRLDRDALAAIAASRRPES